MVESSGLPKICAMGVILTASQGCEIESELCVIRRALCIFCLRVADAVKNAEWYWKQHCCVDVAPASAEETKTGLGSRAWSSVRWN